MQLIALRGLAAGALDEVLDEQAAAGRALYGADFAAQAGRIRLLLELGLLQGAAATVNGHAVAYAQTQVRGDVGLIINHHVLQAHRAGHFEHALVAACLASLAASVRRIEWSTPLWDGFNPRLLPHAEFLTLYRSHLMVANPARGVAALRQRHSRFVFETWDTSHEAAAARLVAQAYREYADAEVDALYRSPAGALQLVRQLTRADHGGEPLPEASFVAHEPHSAELCAIVLVRRVGADAALGELMCVAPAWQRRSGLGLALVQRVLQALVHGGLQTIGLQVAQANVEAFRIYRRAGFEVAQCSALCIWEGFGSSELAEEPQARARTDERRRLRALQ